MTVPLSRTDEPFEYGFTAAEIVAMGADELRSTINRRRREHAASWTRLMTPREAERTVEQARAVATERSEES